MDVIPTGRALGAEITGIDLSQDVSAAQREFIVDAWAKNLVLLFRGQRLSFDDLLRLSELFGPPGQAANQLLGLNSYVVGLPLTESEALLDELWAHACQDKYVWEHKWRVGDLLVWDNRCTLHHRNAFAPNARRLMHQSTTAGEAVV